MSGGAEKDPAVLIVAPFCRSILTLIRREGILCRRDAATFAAVRRYVSKVIGAIHQVQDSRKRLRLYLVLVPFSQRPSAYRGRP